MIHRTSHDSLSRAFICPSKDFYPSKETSNTSFDSGTLDGRQAFAFAFGLPQLNWPIEVADIMPFKTHYQLLGLLLALCYCHTLVAQLPLSHSLDTQHTAELRLTPTPHFVVTGIKQLRRASERLPTEHQRLFKVHVQSEDSQIPALLGDYRALDDSTLSFTPRYPLNASVVYCLRVGEELRAELKLSPEKTALTEPYRFQLPPRAPTAATSVSAVYPTADKLPENLLKFYIHFSAPMSRGQAYEQIQLFKGTELVDKPFLELGEELWDSEQQRFTLFIHPGRIKHGLKSREEAGPALLAGSSYTLRINQAWIDANGQPLSQTFEKKFTATPSDDAQLDPVQWKINSPAAGSTDPVTLQFDEPLDHAMLMRVLEVKKSDSSLLAGSNKVVAGETQWQFTPAAAWKPGTYHIEIATILEDLCGNSIAKPFEVDLKKPVTIEPKARIAIEFTVN